MHSEIILKPLWEFFLVPTSPTRSRNGYRKQHILTTQERECLEVMMCLACKSTLISPSSSDLLNHITSTTSARSFSFPFPTYFLPLGVMYASFALLSVLGPHPSPCSSTDINKQADTGTPQDKIRLSASARQPYTPSCLCAFMKHVLL